MCSSSGVTNEAVFDNVFSNSYVAYKVIIPWMDAAANPWNLRFRFRSGGASGANHSDADYYGVVSEYGSGTSDTYKNTLASGLTSALLCHRINGNDNSMGCCGVIDIFALNEPTILGTQHDRGSVVNPFFQSNFNLYHGSTAHNANIDMGYGGSQGYWRFNESHSGSDYTGFILFCNDNNDS